MANQKKAQVVITANAAMAKKIMDELNQRIAALKQKMDALDVSTKQGQKEFNKLQKELISYNSAAVQNITNTERIDKAMKNLSKTSLADLKRALAAAKSELNKMSANDPGLKKMQNNIKAIQGQIDKVTGSTKQASNAFTSLLKHGAQMVAMYASLNSIKSAITGITDGLFKMSDELTDIRKVSGLTINQVKMLSDAIREIDTRTTVSEMNKLAYVGSKLGVATDYGVEGLIGFTKAANQLGTALHEDLGDEAITQVSKMVQVMGDADRMGIERALLSTGSAIFKLSTTSTSNGKNIVEFSKRLVGLGKASKMTTPEILALGSSVDSMMLMPEVASTAISKFVTSLQTNYTLIEKDLKMQQGSLKKIITEDGVVAAMQEVLKQMKATGGGMSALNFMFKDMGSDGARLKNVLITMAQNYGMLEEHLDRANESFRAGTDVTKEYKMQMETAAAYMERASNAWQKAFVNQQNVDIAKEFAMAWYNFSENLATSEGFIVTARLALEGIFSAIKMIVSILPNLLIGLGVAGLYGAISGIISIGGTLISGLTRIPVLIRMIRIEWAAMNAVMKASVIGAIASVVSMLTMWLIDLASATKEESKANDGLKMSMSEVRREIAKAEAELELYANAVYRAKNSEQEREAAIKQFNQKFGVYLHNLNLEVNSVETMASAYEKLKQAIIGAQLAKLKEKYVEKFVAPRLEWEMQRLSEYDTLANATGADKSISTGVLKGIAKDGKSSQGAAATLAKRLGISPERAKKIMSNPYFNGDVTDVMYSYVSDVNHNMMGETLTAKEKQFWQGVKYFNQTFSRTYQQGKVDKLFEPYADEFAAYYSSGNEGLDVKDPHPDTPPGRPTKPNVPRSTTTTENPAQQAKADWKQFFSNIDAYYNLQMSAMAEQLVASGATEQEQKDAMESMQQKMEKVILAAAETLSSNTDAWTKVKGTIQDDWYREVGDVLSTGLLSSILSEDLSALRQSIQEDTVKTTTSNKVKSVYGIQEKWKKGRPKQVYGVTGYSTSSETTTKTISNKEAAETLMAATIAEATKGYLKGSKRNIEIYNARRKEGLEHDYTGIVDKNTINGLEQLGFVNIDPTSPDVIKARKSVENLLLSVRNNIVKVMQTDEQDILELLWGKNYKTKLKGTPFADLLDASEEDVKIFYRKLIQYNDEYIEAQKKAYAEQKKIWDFMWSKDPARKVMEDTIAKKKSQIDVFGSQQSLMRGWGLTDIDQDSEVRLLTLKLELAQEYYNYIKEHSNDELLIEEAQKGVRTALLESIKGEVQAIKDRGEKIQAFMQPTYDAVESLGDIWIAYKDSAEEGQQAMIKSLRNFIKQYSVMLLQGLTNKAKEGILNGVALKKLSKQYNITEAELKKGKPRKAKSVSAGEVMATTDQPDETLTDTFKAEMKKRGMEDYATDATSPVDAQIGIDNALLDEARVFHSQMLSEEALYQEMLQKIRENPENKDSIMAEYETRLTAEKDYSKEQVAIRKAGFEAMKKLSLAGWQSLLKNEKEGNEKKAEITETTEQGITEVTAANESTRLATQQATQSMSLNSFMEKTVGDVLLGIAGGSAKTVGELGWWGLPLVGVLSAALMGLLNYALSFVGNIGGGSSKSGPNTKLVSGMLTYDSGNVQTYAGTDGNYYSAQSVSRLSTGIVTSPIATTVNGAPALVGERGPEIVVGRETTAAIMRNDPGLLRMLVGYDKIYSGRRRTYDEGNVSALPVSGNALPDTQMADIMMKLLYRLDNPIAPNINMYGRDGLHAKMQQANQFMKGK